MAIGAFPAHYLSKLVLILQRLILEVKIDDKTLQTAKSLITLIIETHASHPTLPAYLDSTYSSVNRAREAREMIVRYMGSFLPVNIKIGALCYIVMVTSDICAELDTVMMEDKEQRFDCIQSMMYGNHLFNKVNTHIVQCTSAGLPRSAWGI
jgi:hypothetical protein